MAFQTQKVRADPLNSGYQGGFLALKSELETINGLLEDQQRVLVALDDSIVEDESRSVIMDSNIGFRCHETEAIECALISASSLERAINSMLMKLAAWVGSSSTRPCLFPALDPPLHSSP
jgi:hypothetical protein